MTSLGSQLEPIGAPLVGQFSYINQCGMLGSRGGPGSVLIHMPMVARVR